VSAKEKRREKETAKAAPASFPGGKTAPAPGELRIAVDRIPYSEIIGHAILQPDVEVGGVLVGGVGEDEHGTFVHVRHAIRAEGAHQENAAVTFTHETWNHIHKEMDAKYPDEQIVGWYHTHGGFGVFLSEMDTFIHQNFFSEPHHLAYVYDPLAGSEGFFVRKGEKLEPVERYWLGGRERRPATRQPEAAPASAPAAGGDPVVEEIRKLTAAVQWSGNREAGPGAEGSWMTYVPWAIAAVCVMMLMFGRQPEPPPEPRTGTLVVDFDPKTLRAITIPLIKTGDWGRDAWALRSPVELPTADGKTVARLPNVEMLTQLHDAIEAQLAKAQQEQAQTQGFLQRWALLGAAALAALIAAAGAAWYFFVRRA
jgi:proteasome lid subunit RPN8/RPN11